MSRRRSRPTVSDDDDSDIQMQDQTTLVHGDEPAATLAVSTSTQSPGYLRPLIRVCAAFASEAEAARTSQNSRYFVRAFEGAVCDGALLTNIDEFESLPEDPTDRFYTLVRKLADSDHDVLVLVDFKSFAWLAKHRQSKQGLERKYLEAVIGLSSEQVDRCQALVISNLTDPEWVAFVPKPYFRIVGAQNDAVRPRFAYYGITATSTAQMNPLPPALAHLVMKRSNLPEMLDELAQKALDPTRELRNPFTGKAFERQEAIELNKFSSLLPGDTGEFRLRKRLWQLFQSTDTSGIQMKNPAYAPITSDVRLDHVSGTQVFVEIKHALVEVRNMPQIQHRLSHMQVSSWYYHPIFTFKAPWDYILTMIDDNRGYLILKDDIPMTFWHKMPDHRGYVHHNFPDHTFLRDRQVDLNRPDSEIVAILSRIMKGAGKSREDGPIKATLTASIICQQAGPCPPELLRFGRMGGLASRANVADFVDEVESDDEADTLLADVDTEDQGDGDDDGEEDQDEVGNGDKEAKAVDGSRSTKYLTSTTGYRKVIAGTREINRNAQLILLIMAQCRRSGQGCVLDLGRNHPMGSIGFIQYKWSKAEQMSFDRTGQPPQWAGKLGNSIPMITILDQYSRWRQSYAPSEGTLGEVRAYRDAGPCIVMCSAYTRETSHLQSQRWVIPSEFMPKVQIGEIKEPGSQRKMTLILKDKHFVDDFLVDDTKLHATLLQFVDGKVQATVGWGKVDVETAPYLKTIGDYKASCDANFEKCLSGHKFRGA